MTRNSSTSARRPRGWHYVAFIAALLLAVADQPRALSAGVVISQVYGGGGNSGATYTNDFVELFNRGTSPVDISGWSVQYASAAGTTWQVTTIAAATLQPGHYFLVQEAVGAGGTTALPAPDASGTIAMAAGSGKVALVSNTSPLSGACPTGGGIIDLAGYGSASCSETSPAPTLTNTTAAIRGAAGCSESDDNAADFASGAPTPRDAASPAHVCGGATPGGIIINEIDSDTPSTDTAEFIELYDGGAGSTPLNGLVVVLYNGSNDLSYAAFDLDGFATNAAGYFTLGNAAVAGVDLTINNTILQNGADAVALYAGSASDFPNNTPITTANLIDAVVYGTADPDDTGLLPLLNAGQPQVDEDDGSAAAANSIQRCPNGSGGARNTNTYIAATPSPDGGNQCPPPAGEHTISEIQGSGATSPFAGQSVITRGIVTAKRFNNGFFIQTPDGQDDGNASTSEAVFVFTGAAPAVNVGDDVAVTGTVAEFSPAADPHQPPVTEIVNPTFTVQATGQPLPGVVTLAAADLSPAGGPLQLEKYEGMRVATGSLTATSPTDGGVDEDDATGGNNGVFYTVFTGTPRPRREPGIDVLDANPPPACDEHAAGPCAIPVFDGNPERLRVDSDGQVGVFPGVVVSSGATLTIAAGVLDYAFRAWTVLPDAGALTVMTPGVTAQPAPARAASEYLVATFNMERFFDTADEPTTSEPIVKPAAYANRLAKASLIVRDYLRTPDVVGVEEAENLGVLQDLAARIDADAAAAGQTPPGYTAYLEEGNDVGGIDVGFLVRGNVTVHSVTQWRKDETYINPNNGMAETLNDRPSLVVDATIHGPADRLPAHVVVVVNHLRSLNDIDTAADGARVRAKRKAQAESVAQLLTDLQAQYPGVPVVSVGDYNAFEANDGYVDVMGIIRGDQVPPDQVADWSDLALDPNMVEAAGATDYSYVFDGNAQSLDHVLLSPAAAAAFSGFAEAHIDADQPETLRAGSGPERFSDHDPAVAYFTFPADTVAPVVGPEADVTVAATSLAGATVTYPLPTATDNLDASVAVTCTPASGTQFPVGTTTVTCTATDDAGNEGQTSFTVTVTPSEQAGTMVGAGQVNGGARVTFAFVALRTASGAGGGALQLAVNPAQGLPVVFTALTVQHVTFAGPAAQFSGTGAWNGRPGYTFQVTAADNGEPGRGVDTVAIVVRSPQGAVVLDVSGTLTAGSVQAFVP